MTTNRSSIVDDVRFIRDRMNEITRDEKRFACQACGTTIGVRRDHRGCSYVYDGEAGDANDPNVATFCETCWKIDDEYWEEMWREYYAGRL